MDRLYLLVVIPFFFIGCNLTNEQVENKKPKHEDLESKKFKDFESKNNFLTMDDYLVNLADKYEGFGGYKFRKDGTLELLIKESKFDSLKQTNLNPFVERITGLHSKKNTFKINGGNSNVVLKKVNFNYKELNKWRNQIRTKAHEISRISFLDIDETKNKIVISTESLGKDGNKISAILKSFKIPRNAVRIEEQERIDINLESMDPPGEGGGGSTNYTLQSQHSTYTGGIQVTGPRNNNCTLGLNVSWANGSRRGFVTASHCTEVFAELDFKSFSQGTVYLGREERDRESFQSWNGDSYCNDNYECKYADVALIEYPIALFQDAPVGTIAKPVSINSIELSGPGDLEKYHVTDTVSWPYVGTPVIKVGQTTGLTVGEIDKSCGDSFASRGGINYMYICTSRADYDSEDGDSGAPIITNDSGSVYDFEVKLAGFHIGGNPGFAIFSGPHYTTGTIFGGPNCEYAPSGWLNSELCNEPAGFGPYEVRNTAYQN